MGVDFGNASQMMGRLVPSSSRVREKRAMPDRLELAGDLWVVAAFFNAVKDSSFTRVIDSLTSGIGYQVEVALCEFPQDLEEGEEPFDGV
jgi:hypothetical protein